MTTQQTSNSHEPAAQLDPLVIQAGGERFYHRPERGTLMLPNGIAIDFGPGLTRLSPESLAIVNKAAQMLSWLQRTPG